MLQKSFDPQIPPPPRAKPSTQRKASPIKSPPPRPHLRTKKRKRSVVPSQSSPPSSAATVPDTDNNNNNKKRKSHPRIFPNKTSSTSSSSRRTHSRDPELHNSIEKKRRAHLAACYKNLKELLPAEKLEKTSNQAVLNSATLFINELKAEEERFKAAKNAALYRQQQLLVKKDVMLRGRQHSSLSACSTASSVSDGVVPSADHDLSSSPTLRSSPIPNLDIKAPMHAPTPVANENISSLMMLSEAAFLS